MRRPAPIVETVIEKCFFLSAILIVGLTLFLFGFMAFLGRPLLNPTVLIQMLASPWQPDHGLYGLTPMIVGTVMIAVPAVGIALPISLGTAALITVFSPSGFGKMVEKGVHLMTGIPTVIYGFVGVFLLVPIIRSATNGASGFCILSAVLLLSILISPTMILLFSETFERIPSSYLEAAKALGATRAERLRFVILPNARSGMMAGIILALGRAIGDTLLALMVAGNAVNIPSSLFDSARTLTSHIALIIAADFNSPEFRSIFVAGMLLYLFTVLLVSVVRVLGRTEKIRK